MDFEQRKKKEIDRFTLKLKDAIKKGDYYNAIAISQMIRAIVLASKHTEYNKNSYTVEINQGKL